MLGFIFGASFVILQKAGLVLSGNSTANNIFMFYAFAIISGVSERFIPDILERKGKQERENA
jgi:hypothetical protein